MATQRWIPIAFAALLGGCATGYTYHQNSHGGDYYSGDATVDYHYVPSVGFGYGYYPGYYPGPYYYGPYRGGWGGYGYYGYPGYGYGGYGGSVYYRSSSHGSRGPYRPYRPHPVPNPTPQPEPQGQQVRTGGPSQMIRVEDPAAAYYKPRFRDSGGSDGMSRPTRTRTPSISAPSPPQMIAPPSTPSFAPPPPSMPSATQEARSEARAERARMKSERDDTP